MTDIEHDFTQTHLALWSDVDGATLQAVFRGLEVQAEATLRHERLSVAEIRWRRSVDMRYRGQSSAELRRGDVVRIVIPGAAGWGPPLNRDPQRVLEDVRSEKFSESYARRVYGVVFAEKRSGGTGPSALELDLDATRKLRRRRLRRRERSTGHRQGRSPPALTGRSARVQRRAAIRPMPPGVAVAQLRSGTS